MAKTELMICYLSRRVKLNSDWEYGHIGADGKQIGKPCRVLAGTVGLVVGIRNGLNIKFDNGDVLHGLKREHVTLLPR